MENKRANSKQARNDERRPLFVEVKESAFFVLNNPFPYVRMVMMLMIIIFLQLFHFMSCLSLLMVHIIAKVTLKMCFAIRLISLLHHHRTNVTLRTM